MISTVVVLPAPFGPRRAKISPALDPERQAATTARPPYALSRPSTSIAGALRVGDRASSAAGDRRVLALEVGVARPRRSGSSGGSRPIDEVALRPGDDPVGRLDRGRRVDDRRPRRAVLGDERRGPARPDRRSGRRRSTSPSAGVLGRAFAASSGNSVRHGTQVGPQKLIDDRAARAGSARSNGWPSRVVPVIVGHGPALDDRSTVAGRRRARRSPTTATTRRPRPGEGDERSARRAPVGAARARDVTAARLSRRRSARPFIRAGWIEHSNL